MTIISEGVEVSSICEEADLSTKIIYILILFHPLFFVKTHRETTLKTSNNFFEIGHTLTEGLARDISAKTYRERDREQLNLGGTHVTPCNLIKCICKSIEC